MYSRVFNNSKRLTIAASEEVYPDYLPESMKSNVFLAHKGLKQFCAPNCRKLLEVPCRLGLPETMLSRGPAPMEEDAAFRGTGSTQRTVVSEIPRQITRLQ